MNKIVIAGQEFDSDFILSGSCYIANSIAGDELGIDTLDAEIDGAVEAPTLLKPADADGMLTIEDELVGVMPIVRVLLHDLSLYKYGDPVYYYHGDTLIGKFYMESVKRVSRTSYALTCTSALGLLEHSRHYGGMYTGERFADVLADIIGGITEYTVDENLVDLAVFGWLPVASRRENLHQLLFAMGASLKKDTAGVVQVVPLTNELPSALADDRLYLGGNIDFRTPVTTASISEHAYSAFATDETVNLYDGEVPAEPLVSPKGADLLGALVLFDGPMHDLAAENVEILESGVNYAVLGQSANCLLTGKAYTHTTRIITAKKPQGYALAETTDNEVSVTDATLVSLANSENVAARVLAYYGGAKMITADMVVDTERPGDAVQFTDPFDETVSAFIHSMNISISNTLRAEAVFVSGYTPTDIGNFYDEVATITSDGVWTVPEGVSKVRVVLIGGGDGGSGGETGHIGRGSWIESADGLGGQPGTPGNGGKVYILTLPVTAGQQLSFTVGRGGTGGVADTAGAEGTATTLDGTYTSADGKTSSVGYAELFGNAIHARPGEVGAAGANGGESLTYNGVTYNAGATGSLQGAGGGIGYGGQGGGAAVGGNGGDGGNGSAYIQSNGESVTRGGDGGIGGSAIARENAVGIGMGGAGGHGGGGGGTGGGASGDVPWSGDPGAGGAGGTGGNGSNGAALIYYKKAV